MPPAYATLEAARADDRIPDSALELSDAELERRLVEAEDLVDRIAGAITVDEPTGRKYVPARMSDGAAAALERITVDLAAVAYVDPSAFTAPPAKRIKGPDFELDQPNAVTPAGEAALRRAAGVLDVYRLRIVTGRLAVR